MRIEASQNSDFLPVVEGLLRLVDPSNKRPIYLVDVASVADSRLIVGDGWIAWTGSMLDLQLMPTLESQGSWAGRGFATLLRLDRLEFGLRFVAGCILHEYAHHLVELVSFEHEFDNPQSEIDSRQRAFVDTVNQLVELWLQDPSRQQHDQPRWAGHELPFVRACCHLSHRAHNVFESIRPAHLRFIKPYHWHPVGESQFVEACSSEIDSDLSIVDILRSPPPRELVELWEAITATG